MNIIQLIHLQPVFHIGRMPDDVVFRLSAPVGAFSITKLLFLLADHFDCVTNEALRAASHISSRAEQDASCNWRVDSLQSYIMGDSSEPVSI